MAKIDNRIKARTRSPKYMLKMAKEGVKPSLRKLLGRRKAERQNFFDAIKRVDYFSGVFPLEYDLVRKNPFFHAKQIFFNYPSSIGMKCEENLLTDLHPKGNSIQVGNSASILGNHRDTLWKIRHLDLHDRKIITPLSYGGDPLYVSTVQKMGKRLFGEQFQPITGFGGFFQCDLKFIKHISVRSSIFRFSNVRTDACSRTKNLIRNGKFLFLSAEKLMQFDDPDRKQHCFFFSRII